MAGMMGMTGMTGTTSMTGTRTGAGAGRRIAPPLDHSLFTIIHRGLNDRRSLGQRRLHLPLTTATMSTTAVSVTATTLHAALAVVPVDLMPRGRGVEAVAQPLVALAGGVTVGGAETGHRRVTAAQQTSTLAVVTKSSPSPAQVRRLREASAVTTAPISNTVPAWMIACAGDIASPSLPLRLTARD